MSNSTDFNAINGAGKPKVCSVTEDCAQSPGEATRRIIAHKRLVEVRYLAFNALVKAPIEVTNLIHHFRSNAKA